MWNGFSDTDLIRLAYDYCLDACLMIQDGVLMNRSQVERILTEYEHDLAFA
jgi:hypothetical protein